MVGVHGEEALGRAFGEVASRVGDGDGFCAVGAELAAADDGPNDEKSSYAGGAPSPGAGEDTPNDNPRLCPGLDVFRFTGCTVDTSGAGDV